MTILSGERTRLACRFRRLAEILFSERKEIVGEARTTAREGACAPRTRIPRVALRSRHDWHVEHAGVFSVVQNSDVRGARIFRGLICHHAARVIIFLEIY